MRVIERIFAFVLQSFYCLYQYSIPLIIYSLILLIITLPFTASIFKREPPSALTDPETCLKLEAKHPAQRWCGVVEAPYNDSAEIVSTFTYSVDLAAAGHNETSFRAAAWERRSPWLCDIYKGDLDYPGIEDVFHTRQLTIRERFVDQQNRVLLVIETKCDPVSHSKFTDEYYKED